MDEDDTQLELEEDPRASSSGTTLERIRAVSVALSDAARRSRVSLRSRDSRYRTGFQARRGARAIRALVLGSFAAFVVLPTLLTAIYMYGFASDQYVSEAQFTVTTADTPVPDGMASMTGVPAIAMIQDTQIVINYIQSRAAVEKLEREVGLRTVYSRPEADWLARFKKDKPIERFVKYWKSMSSAAILMPAGIIDLKVYAFTQQDARSVADGALEACEQMVNDLNARMDRDAVVNAETEVSRASQRVAKALADLETERNLSGIVEADKSEEALNNLVHDAKSHLLSLQGQYDASLKYVAADAPQMRELSTRIDVTRKQLQDIESKLTTAAGGDKPGVGQTTVAQAMTRFDELDMERKVAEKIYATAASALEAARMNAENQQLYFKTFVYPATPQEALYPRRGLLTLLVAGGGMILWSLLCGIGVLVRNNMA